MLLWPATREDYYYCDGTGTDEEEQNSIEFLICTLDLLKLLTLDTSPEFSFSFLLFLSPPNPNPPNHNLFDNSGIDVSRARFMELDVIRFRACL